MNSATRFSIRLYRLVARLFPEEFRALHSRPLLETSEDLIEDVAARHGILGLAPMMLRILVDLIVRVAAEHVRDLAHDARHAVRILKDSPGFTLAATISIALGLGVAIGVFSQLESIVLAPLKGIDRPESLVVAYGVSFPVYEAMADGGGVDELAAYAPSPVVWKDPGRAPERIWAHVVSPNYFEALGVKPLLGQLDLAGSENVILNERLWKRSLGADPDVIGRSIGINGRPMTIVGVTGGGFDGTEPLYSASDVWIPVASDTPFVPSTSAQVLNDRDDAGFSIIGRLPEATTVEQAESRLDAIARSFVPVELQGDAEYQRRRISLLNGGRQVPLKDEELPVILGATAALVFLMLAVAAANVGTLLLARAASRRREVGIRLGLGASRIRILRQFLTEGLILALVAGFAGYAFGWGYKALIDFAMVVAGESFGTSIDPLPMGARMLALSLGLSLGCGLMFGIAPSFHAARASIGDVMKPGAHLTLGNFRWWSARNFLILQQVAGSLALLLLTGFVVLGVVRTTGTDAGFDSNNLHMVSLDPIRDGYDRDRAVEFLKDLPDRVEQLPDVQRATIAYDAPVGLRSAEALAAIQSSDTLKAVATLQNVQVRRIGRRFAETLELPLLQGELLGPADEGNETVPRVLVNDTLAARTWPGQQPAGKILELGSRRYEVAGVVGDIDLVGVMAQTPPTVFRLMTDDDFASPSTFGMALVVRSTDGDPLPGIREMLALTDPDVVLFNATTIQREVDTAAYLSQINMMVYGGIGMFGLLLAAVGISGITAYAVVQRRKEIGIRLALGASRGSILRLVTKEGAVLVTLGMVIGLGIAYAGARAMGAYFSGLAQAMGTTTRDPVLLLGAPLVLGLLTMIAAYVPARRSLGINPAVTLKDE